MTSSESIAADSLYQFAVLRVYGPWLSLDGMPGPERRRAFGRVRHARLVLAMRGLEVPPPAPAEVTFNEMEPPT